MTDTTSEMMKTVTPSPSNSVQSISESIPSISMSNQKTATGVGTIFSTPSFASQNMFGTKTPAPTNGGLYIIKIIFIGIILSLLGYNLYLYIVEGTDILNKYFGIDLWSFKRDVREEKPKDKGNISNVVEKTKDIVTNSGQRIKNRNKTNVQKALENNTQENTQEDNVDQDKSNNNIVFKGNNKGAYCYIGSENGTRSCVKIKSGDSCQSKQIFPSLNMCINPNLRN